MIEKPEKAHHLNDTDLRTLHKYLTHYVRDEQKKLASALLVINPTLRDVRQLAQEATHCRHTFNHEFSGLRGIMLRDANDKKMHMLWPSFL